MSATAMALAAAVERQATDLGSALYDLRAPDVESPQQLGTRVRGCFEASGLATGCAHEVTQGFPAYTDLVPDPWLAAAYRVAITGLVAATDDAQHERLIGAWRERLMGPERLRGPQQLIGPKRLRGRVSRRPVTSVTAAGGAV